MSAPRVGRQGLAFLRDALTPRDLAVVRQVHELKLMSARQIEAVHFDLRYHATALTAARSCRRVLERLVRDRVLVRLRRRVGGIRAGSASYIYGIGPVGQRLLADQAPRRRYREPSSTFVAHTLAITQLVVDLTLAQRAGRLRIAQLQAEPLCWRTFSDGATAAVLRPDLFVVLESGEYELLWFIELDLGTESLPTLIRKCQTYEAYYRTGREQHERGLFPQVVWLVPDSTRRARVQTAIGRSRSLTRALFVVGQLDAAIDVLSRIDDGEAAGGKR